MPKRIVVVGNGMVGHHFVEQFLGSDSAGTVTVLSAERHRAYDRVHLSEVFEKKSSDHLTLGSPEFYEDPRVELVLNAPVTEIDRSAQFVIANGQRYDYDALVLATGSYPFVPPIPGADHPQCMVYRTLDDLDQIQAQASRSKTGVVVGGGLLGLEAANALRALGLDVHVVEFAPRLMPVQLDEQAGAALRRKIEALGVQVHTQKATQAIVPTQAGLQMQFADESVLDTDMIVFSAGIRPHDALAKQSGLELGSRGGITVDDQCRTSDPQVFAIGECAVFEDRQYGLVAPGYAMARTAVSALIGDASTRFTGADMSTKLKLLGVDVGSIGDAHGQTPGAISYRYENESEGIYRRLVVSADSKRLLGAILIGDNDPFDRLLQYALNPIDLPAQPDALILPSAEALPELALPPSAILCSCHNVSRGDIIDAIDQGHTTLGDLKGCTQAATGCGGCAAPLKTLLEQELESRGVEVDRSLCQHFSYTRQELFDIIRAGEIKRFSDLLESHGQGDGCEICKPAVGSMLASCWNENIQTPELIPLQDTNDTFMANMQKNGTYSVVPRIPGGEIKPEMLVVLGQVGQKYDLYTKITGGQRIDLFGATLDELPLIWEELIAAGFETGHAYGKSLRTVKSCVGQTWCRFGVQDSASMAIYLENRYKGLRSPHKLKMAVSGCTRECAEAQSKDIGVIATENGWNLFVGGNGGMRPRHADLFATDLDDETLIRYIDRILMFYVATGDRLQRTSVWLESLEGGLDYLREVVIDDSLKLGAELEARMQRVIDTYQCEWKAALEDPNTRRRFRSFVNADDPRRARIQLVEERGQRIPMSQEEKA